MGTPAKRRLLVHADDPEKLVFFRIEGYPILIKIDKSILIASSQFFRGVFEDEITNQDKLDPIQIREPIWDIDWNQEPGVAFSTFTEALYEHNLYVYVNDTEFMDTTCLRLMSISHFADQFGVETLLKRCQKVTKKLLKRCKIYPSNVKMLFEIIDKLSMNRDKLVKKMDFEFDDSTEVNIAFKLGKDYGIQAFKNQVVEYCCSVGYDSEWPEELKGLVHERFRQIQAR